MGNLLSVVYPNGVVDIYGYDYGYDNPNQVTNEAIACHPNNMNGNVTYEANGNTQTKVTGSNTTTYAWDFENRLSSVTLPGTGGTVSFKYDPFGHRIYKSSSAGTSIFAYDGDNLAEETNSSGAVVARPLRGHAEHRRTAGHASQWARQATMSRMISVQSLFAEQWRRRARANLYVRLVRKPNCVQRLADQPIPLRGITPDVSRAYPLVD
jgi:YD repeat-containing protein